MAMTQEEKQYKKYIRKNILAENGYATYAEILGMLDLHITEDPKVVAYMTPSTGEITINSGLDADAVSVVIRHEILHHFLEHEKRLLSKLAKSQGMSLDMLDDMSINKLRQYLYRNKIFNIAGDYEISNRGYTEEDKKVVRNLVLNGEVLHGLVTEDDHPEWAEWSIEDMYDALLKLLKQDPRQEQPPEPPQFPNGPQGPGGQGGQDGQGGQNNPNEDVQKTIEEIKNELRKAGFSDEEIDDIIDKMKEEPGDDDGPFGDDDGPFGDDGPSGDGDGPSVGGGPGYVDPNNFKSDDEIKQDLKDRGLGERDAKRILKKVKAAKKKAEEEAEKDTQGGAKEGEIGYKGDKATREKEQKEREAQIKKEKEENSDDADTKLKGDPSEDDEEDPYKDYEDDYDSSKESISQRRDRLAKLSKVFSDPVFASRIDSENMRKIQASRDAKAQREVRRYMTSDAMKFQMNIKRFLNNEFGEDMDYTWSRRSRADYGDDRIITQGKKIRDVDRPTKPLVNVYFDQSGSWTPQHLKAGNQAVAQMAKFVRDGVLEMQLKYFDDELHDSPEECGGGTDGTPIIEDIKKTHPANVIIMTDSDINDITESVTVPGMVWILWKDGKVSQNLKDHIHGQKGTEYYNIET